MSEEIKINKYNKSISFIHNNIAFSQFGVADEILDLITDLQTQLQQKENIIKEVREYIKEHSTTIDFKTMRADYNLNMNELLEILDKVGDEK
jgi:hypothetical protein